MKKSDDDIVADFLAVEYEVRIFGGERKYVMAAKQSVEAFARIRDELDRLRREKAVAEFDDVWPGCA